MSTLLWILCHAGHAAFWIWVLRFGGAERLEGTLASGFLVDLLAPRWTAEGIRLFALLMLVVGAVAFVAGLLVPALRCGSTAC